jgi:hypothetical protein
VQSFYFTVICLFRGCVMEELSAVLESSLHFTDGEKQGILITEDDMADLRVKSGRCLIGRLLSDRRVLKDVFQAMMARLWKHLGPVIFKELRDNMWLLDFASESDKLRVKDGRPWLFDRCVLVLKEMDNGVALLQMDFNSTLFWVQVHDMPLTCMNREVGARIGASLGKVDEVDVTGDGVAGDSVRGSVSTLILQSLLKEVILFLLMVSPFEFHSNMRNYLNFAMFVVGLYMGSSGVLVVLVFG